MDHQSEAVRNHGPLSKITQADIDQHQGSATTRHQDEMVIIECVRRIDTTGRARLKDGAAKRLRYALEGAVAALDEAEIESSWGNAGAPVR